MAYDKSFKQPKVKKEDFNNVIKYCLNLGNFVTEIYKNEANILKETILSLKSSGIALEFSKILNKVQDILNGYYSGKNGSTRLQKWVKFLRTCKMEPPVDHFREIYIKNCPTKNERTNSEYLKLSTYLTEKHQKEQSFEEYIEYLTKGMD